MNGIKPTTWWEDEAHAFALIAENMQKYLDSHEKEMSNVYTTLTLGGKNYGYAAGPLSSRLPIGQDGHVATVQTKAGWRGQVKVDGRIVWESKPKGSAVAAEKAAVKAYDRALDRMFR